MGEILGEYRGNGGKASQDIALPAQVLHLVLCIGVNLVLGVHIGEPDPFRGEYNPDSLPDASFAQI